MVPQRCLVPLGSPIEGDCLRACVATVLGLPARQVPHFIDTHKDDWVDGLRDWLKPRGLALFERWNSGVDWTLPEILKWYSGENPDCPIILVGASRIDPNDNHAVVLCDGRIAHDPSNAGISGPAKGSKGANWWLYIISASGAARGCAL